MSVRQSAAALEFVAVGPVTTGTVDPTSDVVEMAFLPMGETPASGDWHTAAWETNGSNHIRRLVAGEDVTSPPGTATVLERGSWVVWVRIADNPEIPVRPVDRLVIY